MSMLERKLLVTKRNNIIILYGLVKLWWKYKKRFWSFNNKKCNRCPNGWTIYTDHCYLATKSQLKTWLEANEACKSLNLKSHLMVVNDQSEFEMLTKFFSTTFGDRLGSLWVGFGILNLFKRHKITIRKIFSLIKDWRRDFYCA